MNVELRHLFLKDHQIKNDLSDYTLYNYNKAHRLLYSKFDAYNSDELLKSVAEINHNIKLNYNWIKQGDFSKESGYKKMKEILPLYNIQITEVERLEQKQKAISASLVRKLAEEGNISQIKELVPEATYKYYISKED